MTQHLVHSFSVIAILASLASCNNADFELSSTGERIGPPPPLGTPRVTAAVDGLVVGDRLMAANEFELALTAYQRAAGSQGLTSEVLSSMGSANLRLGRLHQANDLLNKAVDADATSVSAWNNLGVVLINLQKSHQAREAFRVAFGIDNGNSELIRQNLILANKLVEQQSARIPNSDDFSLVRHGNGGYFLLGI